MVSRIFKSVAFIALAVVAFGSGSAPAANAPARTQNFSKFEIQQIVHDYILENPQLILDAVDGLQKKGGGAGGPPPARDVGKGKEMLAKDDAFASVGSADADVTIYEFMDYNCHFCKDALPTIKGVLEKDKKVRFVFKDFPILGPTSETAAKWAIASQIQKKYFEFHSALMSNKTPLDDALLAKTAKDVGMDVEQAKKDVAGTVVATQLEKNRALADVLGVHGTPAFVIGDEISAGGLTVDVIMQKVADLRAKKGQK